MQKYRRTERGISLRLKKAVRKNTIKSKTQLVQALPFFYKSFYDSITHTCVKSSPSLSRRIERTCCCHMPEELVAYSCKNFSVNICR